jgi:hypothetical protein
MPDIAELTEEQTLKLPPDIAGRFRPSDRFVVWAEGDMLHLKRITPPPVTEIVGQAPEGEPMSLDEINEIVHETRRRPEAD